MTHEPRTTADRRAKLQEEAKLIKQLQAYRDGIAKLQEDYRDEIAKLQVERAARAAVERGARAHRVDGSTGEDYEYQQAESARQTAIREAIEEQAIPMIRSGAVICPANSWEA